MSATGSSHFKKKETMKNYSDRLKLLFAQIRPSFKFTYLALVFSVNKWKSILVKKLAACKKKEWWILVTYHALLKYTSFLGVDIRKKSIKCISTFSFWQIHKDHYQKILSGHRIDDTFFYARFEIYIQTIFYPNSFFIFFLALI